MGEFQVVKEWLVANLSLSKDVMHVFVGLAVFLLVAAWFRLPLRDWRPLAVVALVALAGEAWDLFEGWRFGRPSRLYLAWHDIWLSLFWPAVLCCLARWTQV